MVKSHISKVISPWMTQQFRSYLIIGFSAFVVEYLVFVVMLENTTGIVVPQSVSFLAGLAVSFLGNRHITFKRQEGSRFTHGSKTQLFRYAVIAIVNLLLSNLIIHLLVVLLPALIAKVFVMGMVALWNYTIFGKLIFKKAD